MQPLVAVTPCPCCYCPSSAGSPWPFAPQGQRAACHPGPQGKPSSLGKSYPGDSATEPGTVSTTTSMYHLLFKDNQQPGHTHSRTPAFWDHGAGTKLHAHQPSRTQSPRQRPGSASGCHPPQPAHSHTHWLGSAHPGDRFPCPPWESVTNSYLGTFCVLRWSF